MATKKKTSKKKAKKRVAKKKTTTKNTPPKPPTPVKTKEVGRPTRYTKALGLKICNRIAAGESLRSICLDVTLPHRSTVFRWLMASKTKKVKNGENIVVPSFPAFQDQYRAARELQFAGYADEIMDICDDGSNDWMERENRDGSTSEFLNMEAIQRSKLRAEMRLKILAKMKPKEWGDKVVHESQGVVEHEHKGVIEHKVADSMNFEKVRGERAKLKVVN